LAFLFFAHHDYLRNKFGYKFIDGYEVSYYEDYDEYGREYTASEARASSLLGNIFLYIAQWIIIGICILMPLITYKILDKSIDKIERRFYLPMQDVD